MIDIQRRWVYLHPSKTGGTSIEIAFLNDLNVPTNKRKQAAPLLFIWSGRTNQHWTLNDLERELPFIVGWRKFATVRNPYSRVISEFKYQLKGNRKKSEDNFYKTHDINQAIQSGKIWDNSWAYHNAPQYKYISDEVELIRFENLEEDFKRITGFKSLPHTQKGGGMTFTLDQISKEIIYDRYKKDFELLGYEP